MRETFITTAYFYSNRIVAYIIWTVKFILEKKVMAGLMPATLF